jgi:CheY-like chemotaxis protein
MADNTKPKNTSAKGASKEVVAAPKPVDPHKIDPNAKVVIVLEDSPPNQNILKRILERCGFHVLAGDSGVKGIEFLERCKKQNVKLLLIISDIMMPKMDGHQFLEFVKKSPEYRTTPFLFVTAMNDRHNVIEARKQGVTGYLLKPITMEKLRDKIGELFPDHEFPYNAAS